MSTAAPAPTAAARSPRGRYERKFFIESLDAAEVELLVRQSPALFRPIFHPRRVNNVYFDSVGLESYWQNVCGTAHRVKARVRWYGETFASVRRPTLEIKIKDGLVGWKESYPLRAFEIGPGVGVSGLLESIARSNLPPEARHRLTTVEPVLLNSYVRAYFLAADGLLRHTIDTRLRFRRCSRRRRAFPGLTECHGATVLELKYRPQEEDAAKEVTTRYPFRVTKSSKYAIGVERLGLPD